MDMLKPTKQQQKMEMRKAYSTGVWDKKCLTKQQLMLMEMSEKHCDVAKFLLFYRFLIEVSEKLNPLIQQVDRKQFEGYLFHFCCFFFFSLVDLTM